MNVMVMDLHPEPNNQGACGALCIGVRGCVGLCVDASDWQQGDAFASMALSSSRGGREYLCTCK
eukprot:10573516-Alexandrium_andersonii.AAC.1